jgi:adenine phosphoribosyltransferase
MTPVMPERPPEDRDAMQRLASLVRPIPNFPRQGIVFRDITPLLADPAAMRTVVHQLVHPFVGEPIDVVAGMEARGFIFGALCARELHAGFVPLRKPGKLPHQTESVSYELEYGQNALEVHVDALGHGHRVLLVDDLMATGGTAAASVALIERLGGTLSGCAFVIELDGLGGRGRLDGQRVHSLLHF